MVIRRGLRVASLTTATPMAAAEEEEEEEEEEEGVSVVEAVGVEAEAEVSE